MMDDVLLGHGVVSCLEEAPLERAEGGAIQRGLQRGLPRDPGVKGAVQVKIRGVDEGETHGAQPTLGE